MVAGTGTERMEGQIGFDWSTYARTAGPADADLAFTGLLPPDIDNLRDRFDLTEGLSGWDGNDILRGDNADVTTLAADHTLSNPGLITNLQSTVLGGATTFNAGNIILGGMGSDLIEGRGGDDIIDGDRWLNVRISVRATADPASAETATHNGMTAPLQTAVFAGTINPSRLHAVREIITPAAPTGVDTALFTGNRADYTITINNTTGVITVNHGGGGVGTDGIDTLRNIERLQFADQVVSIAPTATPNPTSLAFGNQGTLSTSAPRTVTVTNTGLTNLVLSGVAIAGSTEFARPAAPNGGSCMTTAATTTLAPNATCTVLVTFRPTTTGAKTGTLQITSNSTGVAGTVTSVPLTGTGIVNGPIINLTPAAGHAFGDQSRLTTSAARTSVLQNTGNQTLNMAITVAGTNPGDFARVTPAGTNCGTTLAAGASCNIANTFRPTAAGARSATLSVRNTATNVTSTIPLTGNGINGGLAIPTPQANFTAATPAGTAGTIAFGNSSRTLLPVPVQPVHRDAEPAAAKLRSGLAGDHRAVDRGRTHVLGAGRLRRPAGHVHDEHGPRDQHDVHAHRDVPGGSDRIPPGTAQHRDERRGVPDPGPPDRQRGGIGPCYRAQPGSAPPRPAQGILRGSSCVRDASRPPIRPARRADSAARDRRRRRFSRRILTSLRAWQERALARMAAWDDGPFLLSAAPGAGKTIPSLLFARGLLRAGVVRRVHVLCPTTPLTRQWAETAGALGVQLAPDAEELHPPRDFDGIVATYARAASSAARWAPQCGRDTLVIADEAHHLGEDLAWGEGFARAFGATRRWLLLSGTPFRSDQSPIAGVRYEDGVAVPDVSYTYADAVRDRICRPVVFIPYDGTLSWQSGDDVVESSFADVLTRREAGRRYRTAISTELADGLPRILRAADERLDAVRAAGHRDAGGLVVTADGEHARRVAAVLTDVTGRAPTVVVHTDLRAASKLRAFGHGRERWLVAVNMVSEGVDIPRLRVGVYASAAKTPLIFRQIVGRFVRTLADRPADHSYLFLPADGLLRAHAAEVETELRHVLAPPPEELPEAFDEARERRRTEPPPPDEFVPLAADVAPQLALFGGGPPAPPVAPAPAAFAGPPAVAPGPAAVPAFKRRATLRDKRQGLVRTLAGIDGRTPREINTWLNRETGTAGVRDASLEQLERSVDLLLAELDRRSRSRRRAS